MSSSANTAREQPVNPDSAAPPATPRELEQAFDVFNQVSAQLDATYRALESRVSVLNEELSVARSARLKELAEKERLLGRLSTLISILPGGVLILNHHNEIRDANPEAIALLGEPLIGECWGRVLERVCGYLPDDNQELELSSGRRVSVVSRILDHAGDSVVLITDVTRIHRLQEQLGRKKRLTALGEMAARLAHQIRTPLSSTVLYLTQLGRNDLADDQRAKVSTRVRERLAHMGHLIDSMLTFVRGGTCQMDLLYLSDVLKAVEASVQPQIANTASSLNIPRVDRSLMLRGDPDGLVGALSNIVMNALEIDESPRQIDVWVGALNPEWLQIVIRDDGPGIEETALERIFDPFFTTRSLGTGLGLAVVAMTVADHGGEVTAANHPAGGAEFTISLPIARLDADANE